MEFFQFCLEIINREAHKFNVAFDTSGLKKLTISSANNANYELVHKRNHFLYRCGTVKLHFANVCFKKFLLDQIVIKDLLSKWNSLSDLTFCSLSSGPAIDYIALLHSFRESGMNPPLFKNIQIVSKFGAWRNTTNIMRDIISEGFLKSLPIVMHENFKVIQGDPFNDFTEKVKITIGKSDVIVMVQRLNLQNGTYDQKKKSKSIKILIEALKPGAVLFCIDNKESTKEIIQILSLLPGKFLFKPKFIDTQIDFVCPNVINELVGLLPILTTNGTFFVWEKSSVSLNCKLSPEYSSTTSHVNYLNCSSPSTSSQITDDCFKRQNKMDHLSPSCPELANACTQTEPDEILQEPEAKKVVELAKRIENLTSEFTKILNSDSGGCVKDQCFEKMGDTCNHLAPSDSNCDHYSSVIFCSKFSGCVQNYKTHCNQCNSFSQCCCSCNNTKIKATSNECEASSCNNPVVNPNTAGSNLSSPQLIIPLTNLSAGVVSQIISLLSQSKEVQL